MESRQKVSLVKGPLGDAAPAGGTLWDSVSRSYAGGHDGGPSKMPVVSGPISLQDADSTGPQLAAAVRTRPPSPAWFRPR
jgi:hypothetical protein